MNLRQSIFQAREMLLDFHENRLDPERVQMVQKALSNDAETQRSLAQIRKGLDFVNGLKNVQVDPALSEQLSHAESFGSVAKRYSRFSNWPQSLKLSSFAVAACFVIAASVFFFPRQLLLKFRPKPNHEVVLSPIAQNEEVGKLSDDQETRDAQETAAANMPTDTDEGEATDDVGEGEASGDEGDEGETPAAHQAAAPAPAPVKPAPVKHVAEAAPQESQENSPLPQAQEKAVQSFQQTEGKSPAQKAAGFVYRGTMKIDEFDERSVQIVDQIKELGGEKAGEVELGWKKDANGAYYHFSLPGANYEKLLDYLKVFGTIRFSKDPNPRVMPDGQVRIILIVERSQ